MGDELFLGLDIGISTVKVALFTGQGELVALESDEYMVMPEGDVVEADPEIYWAPMGRSIRKLLKNWGGDPQRIAAVSISSHGETIFPMRADGKPVRKAINWMDNRSQLESDELLQSLGSQKVLEITGQPEMGPIWPVTKYRWMCKHEPEQVRETASFLLPEDYILFRLSGQFAGEYHAVVFFAGFRHPPEAPVGRAAGVRRHLAGADPRHLPGGHGFWQHFGGMCG